MKNAEKMFMAINNLDERLIDEAKGKSEKPVRIQVEKRLPIKEIIAFAACFVLLAAGIFTLLKYRINNDPVDSSVNPNSTVSNPKEPDTPENQELQAMLKDLTANAMELDGIFTRLSDLGSEHYMMKFDGDYYSHDYCYPIGDNRKTEPLGLFTVPQTQVELEQLLLTCFTEHSAKSYMDNVTTGHITTNDEGKTIIIADPCSGSARVKLIETGGKMYRESFDYCIKLDIDYTTAMVTSKTDKTIKFTYWHTDGTVSDTEGVLVFENGAWKFDYFFDAGFIPITPTEFTEEDEELHDILNELSAGDTLYWWFFHGTSHGKEYTFKNSYYPNGQYVYALLPKGKKDPDSGLEYPQSCEQLEELLLKYFTRENTDKFMENASEGTMSENSDETYTVTTDTKGKYLPIFIEIDGNMYVWRRDSGGVASIWDSAKITERTDDSIKFTMVFSAAGYYYTEDCLITYERGGWKLNYDWDDLPGEKSEPTKEDLRLREILRDLSANAVELDGIFTEKTELSSNKISYRVKVNEVDYRGPYYLITDEDRTQPNGLFAMPKTKSELEAMLLTTFTRRAVQSYLQRVGSGIFVTDTDAGTVINETNNAHGHKTFLEIDGRLYYDMSDSSIFKWYCDPETAYITSQTDKTIRFSYSGTGDWDESTGIIIFEDGGWKLDFFGAGSSVGFIPELPTEFTEEDNELNDILNKLSAAVTLRGWFYNGAYTTQGGIFKSSGDPDSYGYEYSLLPKDEKDRNGVLNYPQSCKEVEELLLKYFTKEIADQFTRSVEKGTMTENPDGTFTVTTESGDKYLPAFLEIDGKMYVRDRYRGGPGAPVWGTAQITEKTSEKIKFTIIYEMNNDFFPGKGSIKYERGGWKLNYDLIDYGG